VSTSARAAAQPTLHPTPAALPLLFGITIFGSACLLFLVQPLAAKLILPWFGGSAAVWIACLLFFQAGLLLGYLYAHALAARFSSHSRIQVWIHRALLLLSLAALPIVPNAMWQPRPGADPTWNLFGALATSVGLPYLLLASTTPLLQSWYAGARHGALPYRYFALSNAGSLLALLSYPILFEPRLTAHQQAWSWSIGFAVFVALCLAATFFAPRRTPRPAAPPHDLDPAPTERRLVLWLSLAACPAALLLAVTNLLTQNIAPMPLLWVVPLGAYLLTFVLCFESARWYKRVVFLPLVLPALGCLAAATRTLENQTIRIGVPLFTGCLFVCCMACHGELARLRPPASRLTTFYLALASGGVLGGMFVALLAPHVFPAMYEYPIVLVACAAVLLAALWRDRDRSKRPDLVFGIWLAACAASLLLTVYACRETWRDVRDAKLLARNFYGALRVDEFVDYGRKIRQLTHGTIIHGVQFVDPLFRHQPTTYYAFTSGAGLAWTSLSRSGSAQGAFASARGCPLCAVQEETPLRMGVVGLGAGTLAAYGRAGDTLRFYDINPAVISVAKTQFTYLADCPAHIDLVLGDARLSLAREPGQRFDMMVIDAFSGDSIPIHLLTREAFQIYWRHLKPDGVLAVHISNHYLDLAPVVKLAADAIHKQAWQVDSEGDDPAEVFPATYVLVSNRPDFFNDPLFRDQLSRIDVPPRLRPWTDDYSNLWQILKFK